MSVKKNNKRMWVRPLEAWSFEGWVLQRALQQTKDVHFEGPKLGQRLHTLASGAWR